MPNFFAVLAGSPLTDTERPDTLPRALADGLQRHGGKLKNVKACGGDYSKWGSDQGACYYLVQQGYDVPGEAVWIACIEVAKREPLRGGPDINAEGTPSAAVHTAHELGYCCVQTLVNP